MIFNVWCKNSFWIPMTSYDDVVIQYTKKYIYDNEKWGSNWLALLFFKTFKYSHLSNRKNPKKSIQCSIANDQVNFSFSSLHYVNFLLKSKFANGSFSPLNVVFEYNTIIITTNNGITPYLMKCVKMVCNY